MKVVPWITESKSLILPIHTYQMTAFWKAVDVYDILRLIKEYGSIHELLSTTKYFTGARKFVLHWKMDYLFSLKRHFAKLTHNFTINGQMTTNCEGIYCTNSMTPDEAMLHLCLKVDDNHISLWTLGITEKQIETYFEKSGLIIESAHLRLQLFYEAMVHENVRFNVIMHPNTKTIKSIHMCIVFRFTFKRSVCLEFMKKNDISMDTYTLMYSLHGIPLIHKIPPPATATATVNNKNEMNKNNKIDKNDAINRKNLRINRRRRRGVSILPLGAIQKWTPRPI
jgi:hypothetical protein